MKLKFRILEFPENSLNRFKSGTDNVPLIIENKYLVFLWDRTWLKSHVEQEYKCKKVG